MPVSHADYLKACDKLTWIDSSILKADARYAIAISTGNAQQIYKALQLCIKVKDSKRTAIATIEKFKSERLIAASPRLKLTKDEIRANSISRSNDKDNI